MDINNMDLYNRNTENLDFIKELKRYSKIVNLFLKSIKDKLNKHKFEKFIINRGVNTIKHVFLYTLFYTRNIEFASLLSKKAYIYFIEFIVQIKQDIHAFLCLTSRDASIFVFKKTIFNIKKQFIKDNHPNSTTDKNIKRMTKYIEILNSIYLLNCGSIDAKRINILIRKIHNLNYAKTTIMITFINHIKSHSADENRFYFLIYFFVKKLNKHQMSLELLTEKLIDSKFKPYMEELRPNKFINWLFG